MVGTKSGILHVDEYPGTGSNDVQTLYAVGGGIYNRWYDVTWRAWVYHPTGGELGYVAEGMTYGMLASTWAGRTKDTWYPIAMSSTAGPVNSAYGSWVSGKFVPAVDYRALVIVRVRISADSGGGWYGRVAVGINDTPSSMVLGNGYFGPMGVATFWKEQGEGWITRELGLVAGSSYSCMGYIGYYQSGSFAGGACGIQIIPLENPFI